LGGAVEEKFAFAGVLGEGGSALELHFGFREAPELEEEIAADGGQQMVVLERRFGGELVDHFQASGRAVGHGHSDAAIQFDDGRGRELGESVIQGDNAGPVCFGGGAGACVTCGDGSLESVRARSAAEFFSALKRREASMNEELIPARAVLIEKQDRFAGRTYARVESRGLYFP
jgi:hypothetical protein